MDVIEMNKGLEHEEFFLLDTLIQNKNFKNGGQWKIETNKKRKFLVESSYSYVIITLYVVGIGYRHDILIHRTTSENIKQDELITLLQDIGFKFDK